MSGKLLIRNDCDFQVKGFRDSRAAAGTYLNAATTATWELNPAKKATAPIATSSGTLTYVASSNGDYVGGIDDAVVLVEGTEYWLNVVLVQGGVRLDIEEAFTAARRTGRTPIS